MKPVYLTIGCCLLFLSCKKENINLCFADEALVSYTTGARAGELYERYEYSHGQKHYRSVAIYGAYNDVGLPESPQHILELKYDDRNRILEVKKIFTADGSFIRNVYSYSDSGYIIEYYNDQAELIQSQGFPYFAEITEPYYRLNPFVIAEFTNKNLTRMAFEDNDGSLSAFGAYWRPFMKFEYDENPNVLTDYAIRLPASLADQLYLFSENNMIRQFSGLNLEEQTDYVFEINEIQQLQKLSLPNGRVIEYSYNCQ